MATAARRRITITYSGDIDGEQIYDAADNIESPAFVQVYKILAGQSITFTAPCESNGFGDFTPTAVTILKDSDYAGTLILKGGSGASDAEGFYLHPTDPDTISIDVANQTTFVLKASADCTLRLVWS